MALLYGRSRAVVRVSLAISALGVSGAISGTPILAGAAAPLAILLAIFTAIDLTADLGGKRRTLGRLATTYSALETSWSELLRRAELGDMSDDEVRRERKALVELHDRMDRKADDAGVVTWNWLNNRCEIEARKLHYPNYEHASLGQENRLSLP